MTTVNNRPRGRYFEEFEVGQIFMTAGRTVTEADVVTFAGLSGDYNQIHTDADYSASQLYGERIAHGLLVVSIATGLIVQTGLMEGTVLLFRELTWNFSQPDLIGATLHVKLEIVDMKKLPKRGVGSITAKVNVINQNDKTVHRGTMSLLIKSLPES